MIKEQQIKNNMIKTNYIGLDLAKKLKEVGCGELTYYQILDLYKGKFNYTISYYDIIVTYATEFFGRDYAEGFRYIEKSKPITIRITNLLQQKKQKECDKYIWENTLFNPKNK